MPPKTSAFASYFPRSSTRARAHIAPLFGAGRGLKHQLADAELMRLRARFQLRVRLVHLAPQFFPARDFIGQLLRIFVLAVRLLGLEHLDKSGGRSIGVPRSMFLKRRAMTHPRRTPRAERGTFWPKRVRQRPNPNILPPEVQNIRPVGPTLSGQAATKSLRPQGGRIFRGKLSSWR
jgi:hypothetical protein